MIVHVENGSGETAITNLKIVTSEGTQRAKWNYRSADGFFVIAFRAEEPERDAFAYLTNVLSARDSEINIRENTGDSMLISLTKANYSSKGVELCQKKAFPYPMKVLVCGYKSEADGITVYRQEDEHNSAMVPIVVKYTQMHSNGILWKSPKETICIPVFDGFFEGLLYYSISGRSFKYPVSEKMLGTEIELEVPRDGTVDIRVHEKWKDRCKCIKE